MWTRAELKEKAKNVLRKSYWRALVVSFIIVIAGGSLISGNSSNSSHNNSNASSSNKNVTKVQRQIERQIEKAERQIERQFSRMERQISRNDWYSGSTMVIPNVNGIFNSFSNWTPGIFSFIFGILAGIFVLTLGILALLFRVLVGYNLEVGGRNYFIRAAQGDENLSNVFRTIKSRHYINIVVTMFLRSLYTFLWSLLFVIPGIVKSYAYRMVPYILAEHPDMTPSEAIALSCQMTNGQKMNMFVLDLSFLGWYFLGSLAFGIGRLFVNPYVESTYAQLYLTLSGSTTYEPTEDYIDVRPANN